MAQLILTIPDALVSRVMERFCGLHQYQEIIDGVPNPETKAEFMKRTLLRIIKREVLDYESREAHKTAMLLGEKDIQL